MRIWGPSEARRMLRRSIVLYLTLLRSFEDKASEFVIIMNGTCKATHSDRGAGGDAGSEMEADKETSEEEKHKSTSHEQIVGLYSSGDWLNDDALKNNRNNPVNLTAVSDKVRRSEERSEERSDSKLIQLVASLLGRCSSCARTGQGSRKCLTSEGRDC